MENLGGRMRSLKKRGPHVLYDLNDLLFSLQLCYLVVNQDEYIEILFLLTLVLRFKNDLILILFYNFTHFVQRFGSKQ